jgi:BON domain
MFEQAALDPTMGRINLLGRNCPRCGQPVARWEPVHIRCILYRLRFVLVPVLIAVAVPLMRVVLLVVDGQWFFDPGPPKVLEAPGSQIPLPQRDTESVIPMIPDPGTSLASRQKSVSQSADEKPGPKITESRASFPAVSTQSPVIPPQPKKEPAELLEWSREPSVPKSLEMPITKPPAESGTYATIRTTSAWQEPNENAEVIEQLPPHTRFTVTGSQGDWLVARSRTRGMTVYIKRDNATLISDRSAASDSHQAVEGHWKQVEADIAENLARMGLTGVTVSVRGEVVYLDGNVRTDEERFRAQSAARKVPGVQSVRNRIMVVP